MTKFLSSLEAIGFALEDPKGTPAEPTHWFRATNITLKNSPDYAESTSVSKSIVRVGRRRIQRNYSAGGFETEASPENLGFLFCLLFGKKPTTTAAGAKHKHTYDLQNDNNHASATIVRLGAANRQYTSSILNTLSISVNDDGLPTLTTDFMGRSSASSTYDYDLDKLDQSINWEESEISVKLAADVSNLNDAKPIKITNFSLEVTKNAQTTFTKGNADRNPDEIINGQTDITGSFEVFFVDNSLIAINDEGTNRALELKFSTGAGDTLSEAIIQLPEVNLLTPDEPFDQNAPLKLTFDFGASATNPTQLITAEVVNDTSEY